jgi:hypothetical protein
MDFYCLDSPHKKNPRSFPRRFPRRFPRLKYRSTNETLIACICLINFVAEICGAYIATPFKVNVRVMTGNMWHAVPGQRARHVWQHIEYAANHNMQEHAGLPTFISQVLFVNARLPRFSLPTSWIDLKGGRWGQHAPFYMPMEEGRGSESTTLGRRKGRRG